MRPALAVVAGALIGAASLVPCCAAVPDSTQTPGGLRGQVRRSDRVDGGDANGYRLYARRGERTSKRRLVAGLSVAETQTLSFTQPPGALSFSPDGKSIYTVTENSLRSLRVGPETQTTEFQVLTNGGVDAYGNSVQYLQGLTALTVSPDNENVYVVGTSVMPGVGGITTMARNKATGELSLAQQFRVDQRQGIADIGGMVGANSVAVSPDGRFVYVSSGGYYRDHNLLVFSRDHTSGGLLSLVQNIDVYNTTESRVLPTTLVISHNGSFVYILGNNYAISTAAIVGYRVEPTTGRLRQVQELGPLRGTLISTAGFDPTGKHMYATASLGGNLVWVFTMVEDGLLVPLVPPTAEGSPALPPPQGSYSGVLSLQIAPRGDLIFVAVEKESTVYAARTNPDGRLTYVSAGDVLPVRVGRPVGLGMSPAGDILYVSSASNDTIVSFSLEG